MIRSQKGGDVCLCVCSFAYKKIATQNVRYNFEISIAQMRRKSQITLFINRRDISRSRIYITRVTRLWDLSSFFMVDVSFT